MRRTAKPLLIWLLKVMEIWPASGQLSSAGNGARHSSGGGGGVCAAVQGSAREASALHLADLDPILIAAEVVRIVYERAFRDALRVGLVARVAEPGDDEKAAFGLALRSSDAFRMALVLAEWATSGRGEAVDIPFILRQVRADLYGLDVKKPFARSPVDLATLPGVALVAAEARLALLEGRTVSAVELATLASIDEHSVRAAVKAGTLRPLGPGRPMRFAADLARAYLYTRGVPGFGAPEAPRP